MRWGRYSPEMAVRWDELVHASGDAWYAHLRGLIDAVTHAFAEPEHSVIVEDNSRLLAILPLHLRAWDGGLWSPGRGAAGIALAPRIAAERRESVLALLEEGARAVAAEVGAVKVRIAHAMQCETVRIGLPPPVLPAMSAVESRVSRVVDLTQGWQWLLDQMPHQTRRRMRKAAREGAEVRLLSPSEAMDIYYPLHVATYARSGEQPMPKEWYDAVWNHAEKCGLHRIYAAALGGRVEAVLNVVEFKGSAWFMSSAMSATARDKAMNYLLHGEAIRHAADGGLHSYDLGDRVVGVNEKLDALADFKTRFGGVDQQYQVYEMSTRPMLRRLLSALAKRLTSPGLDNG